MQANSSRIELLNDEQAAAVLNIKPNTLAVWRSTKRYPLPFVKIGACVRYRLTDLEAFIEANLAGGIGGYDDK